MVIPQPLVVRSGRVPERTRLPNGSLPSDRDATPYRWAQRTLVGSAPALPIAGLRLCRSHSKPSRNPHCGIALPRSGRVPYHGPVFDKLRGTLIGVPKGKALQGSSKVTLRKPGPVNSGPNHRQSLMKPFVRRTPNARLIGGDPNQ